MAFQWQLKLNMILCYLLRIYSYQRKIFQAHEKTKKYEEKKGAIYNFFYLYIFAFVSDKRTLKIPRDMGYNNQGLFKLVVSFGQWKMATDGSLLADTLIL